MTTSSPELLTFAMNTARTAGAVLLDRFGAVLDVQTKGGNPRDLVTDADLAAENVIVGAIMRRYPGHAILSEEAGDLGPASPHRWVIDPLDGTTNFTRGIPFFAVSLALMVDGKPLLGVVFHPVTGDLFYAHRDGGAWLGDRRLAVSSVKTVDQAMVCVEWGKSVESLELGLDHLVTLTKRAYKLRALGSAALNLAYVASGRLDAFVVNGLYTWDVAAGALLVEEAGGRISPSPWASDHAADGLITASNAEIHAELLTLWGVQRGGTPLA